jgi:hypothetical protein
LSISNIERRIERLEASSGVVTKPYVLRLILDFVPESEGCYPYREIRWLMEDDGSEKGRLVRELDPSEIVSGLENLPWLK